MKPNHHGQMSESFLTAVFLSLSGGLQDAYTYLFRGKVFANAQTGNIVLLSANLMDGNWGRAVHYLVPLCAFALGVLTAEKMRERFRDMQRLHWRQLVVLGEVLLLFLVGFLPPALDLLANAIVSFSCAMQVQAFRKVDGYAFASTMCIGDLRSGMEALCIWRKTRDAKARDRMLRYFGMNPDGRPVFILGSGGAMRACRNAVERMGARETWVVSRSPKHADEISYDDFYARFPDMGGLIVNTTPAGMYPRVEGCPIDTAHLTSIVARADGVADIIFNPAETVLTAAAKRAGTPACTGLYMLIAQAVEAESIWQGCSMPPNLAETLMKELHLL